MSGVFGVTWCLVLGLVVVGLVYGAGVGYGVILKDDAQALGPLCVLLDAHALWPLCVPMLLDAHALWPLCVPIRLLPVRCSGRQPDGGDEFNLLGDGAVLYAR